MVDIVISTYASIEHYKLLLEWVHYVLVIIFFSLVIRYLILHNEESSVP